MSSSPSEVETAVRAVLDRYVDAVYHGDAETLKDIFHPAACMNGYLGDKLLVGNPEPFIADIAGNPPMAESGTPLKTEFSALHVSGRTATVTLHEDGFFGSGKFVNYFHLLYDNGEWKIVSKTFESL